MAGVTNHTYANNDRTVTGRQFGVGNGSRKVWNLAGMDSDRALIHPVLYKIDWGGIQQLYSTARTNLAFRSQAAATAPWTSVLGGAGSLTPSNNYASVAAPDGTLTASRLIMDAGGGTAADYSIRANPINTSVGTASAGIWARTTSGAAKIVMFRDRAATKTNLMSLDGTWRYFTLSGFTTGSPTTTLDFMVSPGNYPTTSQAADILIWGLEVEATVSVVGAYIPTTVAAVTVTDYSTDSAGKVTFASAPAIGTQLTYKDPYATNVYRHFGLGDGSATQFSLPFAYVVPSIYVNGALQTLTTHYSVSPNGDITFVSAPADTAVLTWTGNMGHQR